MLIFIIGIFLGLLFTRLYRNRMGVISTGILRIGMYTTGLFLSILYSLFLVLICSIIAPKEYYASKIERIGAIKTIQKIHGDLHLGFGEISGDFYYRYMSQHEDAGIYSAEIPTNKSIIYEDATSNPQVITICARNTGFWYLLTFPDNTVYVYAIHVAPGTTVPGGSIQ